MREDIKQVLLDWDQQCLCSDDLSVACRFAYLIPHLRRQRQEFTLCDGDLGIHCMHIHGGSHLGVLSGTSGFFGGAGFGFAATLLVVSGAYTASLALANGCTGGSSSLLTSSGAAGGGGGSRADGTGGEIGATGAGAGGGIGLLAGVRASVDGSGL